MSKGKFERYEKYYVCKVSDAEKYLSSWGNGHLQILLGEIEQGRKKEGKKINSYVVVNCSAKCAEKVWKLVEKEYNETH